MTARVPLSTDAYAAELRRRTEERMAQEGFYPSGQVYEDEHARRCRSEGPAGQSYVVEIITDEADTRGLDAKFARVAP